MSLTLYQMAHSPFCIPIAQVLRACRTDFEPREVPNWDRRELLTLTDGAYYEVPLLMHNGRAIFESRPDSQVVAHYVDEHFTGRRLFPAGIEGMQSFVIDFLEGEVEGRTFRLVDPDYIADVADLAERGMIIRHKERKFGRGCVEAWRRDAAEIRAEADALLVRFELTLKHQDFLFGASPVYSDFLLFGILGNLTWKGRNALDADRQPALAGWFARMGQFRF